MLVTARVVERPLMYIAAYREERVDWFPVGLFVFVALYIAFDVWHFLKK